MKIGQTYTDIVTGLRWELLSIGPKWAVLQSSLGSRKVTWPVSALSNLSEKMPTTPSFGVHDPGLPRYGCPIA